MQGTRFGASFLGLLLASFGCSSSDVPAGPGASSASSGPSTSVATVAATVVGSGGAAGSVGAAGTAGSTETTGAAGTGGGAGTGSPADASGPGVDDASATADVAVISDAGLGPEARTGMPPIADGTEYMKNGPYSLPPEAMANPNVPRGDIFPQNAGGRNWTLYVPKQYDAAKPAAFMVFQDGTLYGDRNGTFRTPNVLDNLIAAGELPVMLAAFIPPGANRSVDYDTLSDAYVTFILQQILPVVEAKYKITKNPSGRGLGGQSSGGIAAFTAAWQRPDQFRRVLSDNGSYTNIRGGDQYPSLIMAGEVKPLRVTLLSSTNDIRAAEPTGWLQANKNMAAALKQKGYPYIFMQGNGQHYPPQQAASVHPMHMRWLWWDYVPDGT